jgi:hypothetical protein
LAPKWSVRAREGEKQIRACLRDLANGLKNGLRSRKGGKKVSKLVSEW